MINFLFEWMNEFVFKSLSDIRPLILTSVNAEWIKVLLRRL